MDARQTLKLVREQAHLLIAEQYKVLNDSLFPALENEGIRFWRRTRGMMRNVPWVREFFFSEVIAVLTPIGLDPRILFLACSNKSLNFAVNCKARMLFGRNSAKAIVQAPRVLPRTILLPPEIGGCPMVSYFCLRFCTPHVGELFGGMESVEPATQFRVDPQ